MTRSDAFSGVAGMGEGSNPPPSRANDPGAPDELVAAGELAVGALVAVAAMAAGDVRRLEREAAEARSRRRAALRAARAGGVSAAELAAALRVSRQRLYRLLGE